MAIAYKSAGAGASTETSGAACSPASPAVVDAGDILIVHAYFEGTTTAPGTPSGFTLLSGPHVIETTIGRHWIYGKVADGTEDGAANALGTAAVTTMRSGRCYSFSGRVAGTITDLVLGFAATSHATDPQMPTVTTTIAGGLAVACMAQNDNNASASATGETGGDWVEAVAEFVAALTPGLQLQLQTCTPTADPGTVSGGAIATTNDPCGVIGFEIRPEVPATPIEITASITEAGETVAGTTEVRIEATAAVADGGEIVAGTASAVVEISSGVTEAGEAVVGTLNVVQPTELTGAIVDGGETVAGTVEAAVSLVGGVTEVDETAAGTVSADVQIAGSVTDAGESVAGTIDAAVSDIEVSGDITDAGEVVAGAVEVPPPVEGPGVSSSDMSWMMRRGY